jgi:hypothetical protein
MLITASLLATAAAIPTIHVYFETPSSTSGGGDVASLLLASPWQPFSTAIHLTLDAALSSVTPGDGLLLLADGSVGGAVSISPAQWARLLSAPLSGAYVEMPTTLPGSPKVYSPSKAYYYDRIVVRSERLAGLGLAANDLLQAQGAFFQPYAPADGSGGLALINASDLVYAHVAGSSTAVYGLTPPAEQNPVLFSEGGGGGVLVGGVALSCVRTCRYAPVPRWVSLWNYIISRVAGAPAYASFPTWDPLVRPAGADPSRALAAAGGDAAALRALAAPPAAAAAKRAADFLLNGSGLLVWGNATACPAPFAPADATIACMMEGFESEMSPNGTQGEATDARMDCSGESAMVLALRAGAEAAAGAPFAAYADAAVALLNFVWLYSAAAQAHNNASAPDFGIVAWGVSNDAWSVCSYGDDNARTVMGSMVAADALRRLGVDTAAWDEMMVKSVLANLRLASRDGFRPGRINFPDVAPSAGGWARFHYSNMRYDNTSTPQPHYQSQMWALFLLTFARTCAAPGSCFAPLLDAARAGLEDTMAHYPRGYPAPPRAGLPPCAFSNALNSTYVPGCALGCAAYPDAPSARAACAAEPTCGGVTSGNSGAAPWTLRAGATLVESGAGAVSYLIANAAACRPPAPPRFQWTEYLSEERGRLLLPLAWLLRAEAAAAPGAPPNATHVAWLRDVAADYLATQAPCGAVAETLGRPNQCDMCPPATNAAYGTGEAPLIDANGEQIADFLYGNNYALVSLIEAAAADPGAGLEPAALRLAAFTAAAQAAVPGGGPLAALEGAWLRAFHFGYWDFWGAAADWGWGPWSVETGWTVSWASTGLLLAAGNSTLWDAAVGAPPGGINAALLQKWCPVLFNGTDVACAWS